jgi:hypothetical protein
LQGDHGEQEDEGQPGDHDIEGDFVGRLLALRAFHEGDHAVQKGLAGVGGDRTLIQSLSTLVPPVTALRSPPDSRITGALSPVMADSSTLAMPSMTSPSPGMVSPASTMTVSPERNRAAATISVRPPFTAARGGFGLGLAQGVGLRLAAALRHGFGEVGEQHGEPQPERDLEGEAGDARAGGEIAHGEDGGHDRARLPPRT